MLCQVQDPTFEKPRCLVYDISMGWFRDTLCQWEFQEPKLEVPTIYKAYFSGLCKGISPQNMARNMVLTYLHFRILEFPLIVAHILMLAVVFSDMELSEVMGAPSHHPSHWIILGFTEPL